MSDSVKKFVVGKLYRFKEGYERKRYPLFDYADCGDVAEFNGKTLGCMNFTLIKRNKEITLPLDDAVRLLDGVE